MIVSLFIENYALVEKLDITFSNKFSIITGETGAGKSILLDAIGLVLGNRADLNSLKNKEQKCIVEAHFNIEKYNLNDFFLENDLDYENETIIRREILPSGKSRAFINDSPVNLSELEELGSKLIAIHSQNQSHELSEESFQINILDIIGNNQAILSEYKEFLSFYKSNNEKLKKLEFEKENLSKEADYNSFLLKELLDANLKDDDQEELESSYEKLNNIEFIKESIDKAIAIATDEQIGVILHLKEIKSSIQKIAPYSSEYNEIFERVSSVLIEFDDTVNELQSQSEKLFNDPERLEIINQKLQSIYSLQKKHNVSTITELIEIQNGLENKVNQSESIDTDIENIKKEIAESTDKLNVLALSISENRKKTVPILVNQISEILSQIGLLNARFEFEFSEANHFLSNGKDEVQLLFSANKGTNFGLLKKVASGGEISRIMLALKSVLANYSKLPTIVFDEIDTGVSGEIAQKMGLIMKDMSKQMQVFSITHLPQVASKGDQHYKVFKIEKDGSTVSQLKLLTSEERVVEIAEMLSGTTITESALSHAKALLN